MSSLYNIQEELLRIFNNIEENDGEITDEQCNLLEIKQEELKSKLSNYVKAIKSWDGDITSCKIEEQRIANVRKKYDNRIKRLKESMLQAVSMFGEQGKTGNKFIELPTIRLFTKSSNSVELDDVRIKIFISEFERYIRELVSSGIMYTEQDVDLQGILDCINANCIAEHGEEFKRFTLTDLTTIKLEISTTMNIYELFRRGGDALRLYGNNPIDTNMINVTGKDDWKNAINNSSVANISKVSVASIVTNQSIQMK